MTYTTLRTLTLFGITIWAISIMSQESPAESVSQLTGYTIKPFSIPIDVESIHLIDLNADARQDLILEFDEELRVVHQEPDGFSLSRYQSIPIPAHSAMWDVARYSSDHEDLAILVLDSRSSLTIWQPTGDSYQHRVITVPLPSVHLPKDTNRSRFCIDVNGDSIDDLALPTTHVLHLFLLDSEAQLSNASKIPLLSTSSAALSADELGNQIGQRYTASSAVFYDTNDDSHTDAVLQNDSTVQVTLGNASETHYFSEIPDYDVNFEKGATKIDFDSIDLSNLFALVRFAPNRVQLKDVNQDNLVDLTILEPNRVISYIASKDGIDTTRPSQILRFNENTLVVDLLDVNDDGNTDLVTLKTPHVSVRKVLLTLMVPASLRFELYAFIQSDGMYSRRPDDRLVINVKVPALLPMAVQNANLAVRGNEVEASVRLDLLGSDDEAAKPILDAQLDEIEANDVIVIQSGEVRVYFNVLDTEEFISDNTEFDHMLEILKSHDELTVDVGTVMDSFDGGTTYFDLIEESQATVIHRLNSDDQFHDLMRFRMNEDEHDDIMIFEDRTNEAITGFLLLSEVP